MKIPNKIKIAGEVYTIKYSKELRDDGFRGKAYFEQKVIMISSEISEEQQFKTFIHELLHCCCDALNLQNSGALTEEYIVGGLANMLYMVLKDNGVDKV
jgi:hypothetical protein